MVDPEPRLEREASVSAARITSGVRAPAGHVAPKAEGGRLPGVVRRALEPTLGVGLSDLRIHAGARGALLADAFDARAFTMGRDLYFGAGQYEPRTRDGLQLVAHEATHAMQQGATRELASGPVSRAGRSIQRQPRTASKPQPRAAATGKPPPPLTIPWTGSVESSLFDYIRALGLDDASALTAARAVIGKATAFTINEKKVTRDEFEHRASTVFILDAPLVSVLVRVTGIDVTTLTKTRETTVGEEKARAKAEGRGVMPGQEQQERSGPLERPPRTDRRHLGGASRQRATGQRIPAADGELRGRRADT